MIQVLYNGYTGLTSQQKNIDVIANNVANIQTDGYKKTRFDFQDCLYTRYLSPEDNSPEKNLQRGHGGIGVQTAHIFLPGSMLNTERPLDVALETKGFFVVENGNPDPELEDDTIQYTRNGSFYISTEEAGNFLVDGNGNYILSQENERISFPNGTGNVVIDSEGQIYSVDEQANRLDFGKLQVVDFVNPGGLASAGGNRYRTTANSGEMLEVNAKVKQGFVEGSNVDYSEEVTRMVRAQRAYQMAARVVSTADDMMNVVNTIRQ